jgi:hypothetical protein
MEWVGSITGKDAGFFRPGMGLLSFLGVIGRRPPSKRGNCHRDHGRICCIIDLEIVAVLVN